MRPKLLLLFLVCLFNSLLYGQIPTRFYSQNPTPNDKYLRKPFMLNQSYGYIAGYRTILKTTDGGVEWKSTTNPDDDFYDLHFFTPTQGIVVSFSKIYYTNDGAETWNEASTTFSGGASVAFADNQFGMIAGIMGHVLKTTNGGISWDTLPAITTSLTLFKIAFLNSNTVFAGASGGTLFKSTNRGSSWSSVTFPDCANLTFENVYASGDYVYALATGTGAPVFKRSSDGGNTFETVELPDETIKSFCFWNPTAAAMPAAHGRLYTYNSGSFTYTDLGVDRQLISVSYGDPYHALMITDGEDIQLIFSYDGLAVAWYQRTTIFNRNQLHGSYFLDTNNGWMVGDNGTILNTTNGGYDWITQTSNTTLSLADIRFIDHKTGFAVGASGVILKTTDGGNTWENIVTLTSNLNSVFFLNMNTGYCGAGSGDVYKTTNGGVTWLPVSTGLSTVFSVFFTSPLVGYAGGQGMVKTTDGGATWSMIVPAAYWVYDILFTNMTNGYYGSVYAAYRTTNAGATWETNFTAPGYYIWDISFFDENNGCLAGPYNLGIGSVIARTTNGGVSWYSTSSHYHFKPRANLCFQVDPKNMIAGTHLGSIARTVDDSIIVQGRTVYGLPGSNVDLGFLAHFPRQKSFSSVELFLRYDTLQVQFSEVELGGTITGAANWSFFSHKTGTGLNIGGIGLTDIKKGGDIIKLRMHIKDNASGVIPVVIDSVRFNTGEIFITKTDGKIIINQIAYGDVDLNGFVQAYDGALILKYLAGYISLNETQLRNADVTTDGTVSALDAAVIVRYVIREIQSLPYTGTGPAFASPGMLNMEISALTPVNVPVYFNGADNIFGIEGILNFNSSHFDFEGFLPGQIFSAFSFEVRNSGNSIIFAGASSDSVETETALLGHFRFRPKTQFAQSVIALYNLRINENLHQLNQASSVIRFVTATDDKDVPDDFYLGQNFPNPFNPSSTIRYQLPVQSYIKIEIFNLLGEKQFTLFDGEKSAGYYSVEVNAANLGSGFYIYRFCARGANGVLFTMSRSMILLK